MEKDLEHLLHLLDGKDAVWQSMIERSTSNMACQAWRYEPEVNIDIDFTKMFSSFFAHSKKLIFGRCVCMETDDDNGK